MLLPVYEIDQVQYKNNGSCIIYNPILQTITVACRSATLTDVYNALRNPDILAVERKIENNNGSTYLNDWFLNANLVIQRGANFLIDSTDTAWLKINSTGDSAYKIESLGDIVIDSVKISSWNSTKNAYGSTDINGTLPRSYITINSLTGTANISNSEIAYMGYNDRHGYGITYQNSGKGSFLKNNNIHSLWHGFYSDTNNLYNLLIQNNRFYNNNANGIYLHNGPHDILILNNTINNNDKHGLICSKVCNNIIVENNRIFQNSGEGVILYKNVTNSIIRNNSIYTNMGDQIYLDGSSNNQLYGNYISSFENAGIRTTKGSANNEIIGNVIENSRYGIYALKQSSHNLIQDNKIIDSSDAGIFMHSGATANIVESNVIINNTRYGIHIKDNSTNLNVLKYNQIQNVKHEGIKLSGIEPESVSLIGNTVKKEDSAENQNHSSNIASNVPFTVDKDLNIEVVYDGINFPTAMAFIDNNDILALEKNSGNVLRIINGSRLPEPLLSLNVSQSGERGLLGLAVGHDTEEKTTYIFIYFTEFDMSNRRTDSCNIENSGANRSACEAASLFNRLVRYELSADKTRLINPKPLLEINALPGPIHNGGNIVIGPDKNLYVGVGDVNKNVNRTQTQNVVDGDAPDGTAGILQITQDGHGLANVFSINNSEIPSGLDKYYAYGVRNIFGMDFDPLTGILWDTENGPNFGDEINIVRPGFNSGWQKVQGFWTPNGTMPGNITLHPNNLVDFKNTGKYRAPELTWYYATGLTALKFLDSDKLGKQYENDLFVADFNGGKIFHFDLDGNRYGLSLKPPIDDKIVNFTKELDNNIFAEGFVGITDMEVGPEGYLYVLCLSNKIKNNCGGKPCADYDSLDVEGTIYKISKKTSEFTS